MKRNLKKFAAYLLFASVAISCSAHDVGESSRAWEGPGCQRSASEGCDS